MIDILRDAAWQPIGIIVAFVASLTIARWQQTRKTISCQVIDRTSLFSVRNIVKNRLKVSFDNKVVEELEWILVSVKNSGNVPILKEDYEKPIRMILDDSVNVVHAHVVRHDKNTSLDVSAEVDKNAVILKPMMINPGEQLFINIMADKNGSSIKSDGRIVGIRTITIRDKSEILNRLAFYISIFTYYAIALALCFRGLLLGDELLKFIVSIGLAFLCIIAIPGSIPPIAAKMRNIPFFNLFVLFLLASLFIYVLASNLGQ